MQSFIDYGLLTQNADGNFRVVDDPNERAQIQSASKSKYQTMQPEQIPDRRKAQQFVIENPLERADSDEELENELEWFEWIWLLLLWFIGAYKLVFIKPI